jgi:hypothetical protein
MKDKTIHDLAQHLEHSGDETVIGQFYNADGTLKRGKTKEWYKSWPVNKGVAKCPVCGAGYQEGEDDEPRKVASAAKSNSGHDGHGGRKTTVRRDRRNAAKPIKETNGV